MASKARRLSADQMRIVLKDESGIDELISMIKLTEFKYPIEVCFGEFQDSRSKAQNRLQYQWWKDAEEQGDQKAWEYRGYCKLHYGIPILRRDSVEYREKYDQIIKPLTYESKLALMLEPLEYPVTSAMTVKQHGEFLDRVWRHFTEIGIKLTNPEEFNLCQSHG